MEALDYDIGLMFDAKKLNSATIVEKYNEVIDLAIEATLHLVLR